MFLDALSMACTDQAVTADAASENTIDLGDVTPKRAVGTGEVIGFMVAIKAVGTQTGSAVIQAISSAAADLGTPTVMASISLATAGLALGQLHFIAIPPGQPILRYVGLYFDITGTVDFTVDACLIMQSGFQSAPLVAKGFTVS